MYKIEVTDYGRMGLKATVPSVSPSDFESRVTDMATLLVAQGYHIVLNTPSRISYQSKHTGELVSFALLREDHHPMKVSRRSTSQPPRYQLEKVTVHVAEDGSEEVCPQQPEPMKPEQWEPTVKGLIRTQTDLGWHIVGHGLTFITFRRFNPTGGHTLKVWRMAKLDD